MKAQRKRIQIKKVLSLLGCFGVLHLTGCGGNTVTLPNPDVPDRPVSRTPSRPTLPTTSTVPTPNSNTPSSPATGNSNSTNPSVPNHPTPPTADNSGNSGNSSHSVPPPENPQTPPVPNVPQAPSPPVSTDYCQADHNGNYSFDTHLIKNGKRTVPQSESGSDKANDVFTSEGGGCIARPLREVWAVSLNQTLMKWAGMDKITPEQITKPPGVVFSYAIRYEVYPLPFTTLSWNMNWFHTLEKGTLNNPESIIINFKKVSGSNYITWWRGFLFLEKITDSITSFGLSAELLAYGRGEEDAKKEVNELHDKLKSGQPNWGALSQNQE